MVIHTIAAAAAALRSGTVSSADLIDASLQAVDRHNARTNAFIRIDAAAARSSARLADDERKQGIDRGPLHGVPISLKDLIDVAGQTTTAASRVLNDRVATSESGLITSEPWPRLFAILKLEGPLVCMSLPKRPPSSRNCNRSG